MNSSVVIIFAALVSILVLMDGSFRVGKVEAKGKVPVLKKS